MQMLNTPHKPLKKFKGKPAATGLRKRKASPKKSKSQAKVA